MTNKYFGAGLKNEVAVETYFRDSTKSYEALGAVIFDDDSFDESGQLRRKAADNITYKIRLRAEQYSYTYDPTWIYGIGDWFTSNMEPLGPKLITLRLNMFGYLMPGKLLCGPRFFLNPRIDSVCVSDNNKP